MVTDRCDCGGGRPQAPASKGLGVPSVYYPPCYAHAVSPSPTPRPGTLWVPKTSSMSCEQAIFVDQASGASVFSDAVLLKIDRLG
jgi:hypothetical protein